MSPVRRHRSRGWSIVSHGTGEGESRVAGTTARRAHRQDARRRRAGGRSSSFTHRGRDCPPCPPGSKFVSTRPEGRGPLGRNRRGLSGSPWARGARIRVLDLRFRSSTRPSFDGSSPSSMRPSTPSVGRDGEHAAYPARCAHGVALLAEAEELLAADRLRASSLPSGLAPATSMCLRRCSTTPCWPRPTLDLRSLADVNDPASYDGARTEPQSSHALSTVLLHNSTPFLLL